MSKPKLLDLFCGAGGAGMGYYRAGFEVVGVDIKPQPRYPFEFIQGDALEYARQHGKEFDVIHASPPCQVHSGITPDKTRHVDLIPQTREVLQSLKKIYVIENVNGARRSLCYPITLCGAQFGLKVYRHRLFESNRFMFQIPHFPHNDNTPPTGHGISRKGFISPTSGGNSLAHGGAATRRRSGTYGMSNKGFVSVTGHFSGIEYCRKAMGIDWMTGTELSQAIPPDYTEFIGRQIIQAISL